MRTILVRPKKHLGQHFLHDQRVASQIVEALPLNCQYLLEIGPGTGVLTKYLLERPFTLYKMVEIDGEAVEHLRQVYALGPEQLLNADFLRLPLENLFPVPYWMIGNFPYNISTQILFRVYEHVREVEGLVGMFQREVARRIASGPGSKEYGILSVLIQSCYHVEYLQTVPEGAFFPPPAVKSGVIRLSRLQEVPSAPDRIKLARLVKAAFNQRRKTLRNALRSAGFPVELLPGKMGMQRAEQLDVSDYLGLIALLPDPL